MAATSDIDASSGKHLAGKYSIVGIGETTYTRGGGRTTRAMATTAIANAMADAGLTNAVELPIAASVARIAASDAGWLAAKENVQTHGGMGYTWEGDAHLFYRRAKLLGLTLGAPREWKRRLMQELRTSNASLVPSAD